MKYRAIIPAVLAAGLIYVSSAQSAQAFGLLDRVMYGGEAGCCAEATCAVEPKCAVEPTCCGAPKSCRPKRCHKVRRCRKPRCCEPKCEVTCAVEPTCCGAPKSCLGDWTGQPCPSSDSPAPHAGTRTITAFGSKPKAVFFWGNTASF